MSRTLIHMPRRLLLAAALAGLGAAAMAQSPAAAPATAATSASASDVAPAMQQRMMRQGTPGQWRERMTQRHAQYLARLKTTLAITPEQEGAWSQFEAAMQPPAPPAGEPGEWAKLTTPERIDRMEQRMADRQQRFKQRGDAVKTFYAQLTPAQQKTFDQHAMMMRMGQERGEPGAFGGRGGRGAGQPMRQRRLNQPAAAASQAS